LVKRMFREKSWVELNVAFKPKKDTRKFLN
jgi:hypothetical protein